MLDNKGFDIWSEKYDSSIAKNSDGYPFEGYYEVLNFVYDNIDNKTSSNILDIGVGTGLLSNRLYDDGAQICGIDFSQGMIEQAKKKMPNAHFILQDLNNGIPSELENKKFDYIVSSYAIHHIEDDKKIDLLQNLKGHLNSNGKIIIADVAFKTADSLEECKKQYIRRWDDEEFYFVYGKISDSLEQVFCAVSYTQVSSCAGVLILE